MSDLRRWVNPYRKRLSEYSERIFELEKDEAATAAKVEKLRQDSGACFCELGSGSGNHLVELGLRHPDAAVFGFEIRYKRSVRTIEKAQAAGVANVFVIRTPAEQIEDIFTPRTLDRVYVNFPDPWAKRKQWKHRILSKPFLDSMFRLLKDEGVVSVKTDHDEYFQSFRKLMLADERFLCSADTNDYYSSEFCVDNIATEFEQLFTHKGLSINYLSFLRRKRSEGTANAISI